VTALRELIQVEHRAVRAVSLDADLGDPDVLRGYSPGAHVIDALRRITTALQDGARTRAWSITGPYGAGKSSFAHLVCSLLAEANSELQRTAQGLIRAADRQLAETLTRERRRQGIDADGIIPAVVVAEQEPIARALLRGLLRGAEAYWTRPGRKPALLHRLRDSVERGDHDPQVALSLLEQLIEYAPALVIVDEFGKNLQYAADLKRDGDLYLLQQLAERFSSSQRFDGGILTLAHLAYEDYLGAAGDARRREWRKIHGRFDDIPFVANTAHALHLLAEALPLRATAAQCKVITAAAQASEEGLRQVAPYVRPLSALVGSAAAVYPLHPTVALALPSLASKLGQHDRSLVAFLTSDAPHALPRFLERHEFDQLQPTFVRLADLYGYFFEDGAATMLSGADGERAREIKAHIDDATQLEDFELRVLKSVAILNLMEGAERLIATTDLIAEAVARPEVGEDGVAVRAALDRLLERSLLTYREFAGEYRIWQGSDFNTRGEIRAARERITLQGGREEHVLAIVAEAQPLRPAVARRHSQQFHVLRYFECRYASDLRAADEVMGNAEDADGLVLYVLSESRPPRVLPAETIDGRPLVVVWSPYGAEVRELALEYAASSAVLTGASELERDSVARREIRHRVASLQTALADRVNAAFSEERPNVMWFVGSKRQRAASPAEFSRLLSSLCDARYPQTPVIRNEMINRRELTSQGSKARRTLLERMFTHEHEARLGLEGYGPERAMYEAVLHHTGLHRKDGSRWRFADPLVDSDLALVWRHLTGLLDNALDEPLSVAEIYRQLLAPPFGMKVGAIPVLLAAALQHRSDDIFLYQDGTFEPVIGATHIERLLKTPERFALKRASLVGVRASVFEQLRQTLAPGTSSGGRRLRNETTLSVVRPLVTFASELSEYTQRTKSTSEIAQRVCTALLTAREPDELLFVALPQACGLRPFSTDPRQREDAAVADYVERLGAALAELAASQERLLDRIGDLLHAGFGVAGPRSALREDLRTRSRRLIQQVIDPKMRSLLTIAGDENLEGEEWLEAIAMAIASKPPRSWNDHDMVVFEALVAERSRWFRRLELLYHEMNAVPGAQFDARRVTLTAPDGNEHAELVTVDATTRQIVADVLEAALNQLAQRLPEHQAPRALLGVLADRVLSGAEATTTADAHERKADIGA
jgi:hypothetical protein